MSSSQLISSATSSTTSSTPSRQPSPPPRQTTTNQLTRTGPNAFIFSAFEPTQEENNTILNNTVIPLTHDADERSPKITSVAERIFPSNSQSQMATSSSSPLINQ